VRRQCRRHPGLPPKPLAAVARAAGAIVLAALVSVAAAVTISAAAAATTSAPAGGIVGKPRTKISFAIESGRAPAAGRQYSIGPVVRNGRPAAAPPRMKVDPKTGAVTWEPTESQVGEYRITFHVKEPPRRARTVTRHLTIRPGPITTVGGELGRLLKLWYADGSAAGNVGDFYDNRDKGHSHLNMAKFPQLDKLVYPEAMQKRRLNWGLQRYFVTNHVTLGNSSTAGGPTRGGSNSRRAVLSARTAGILYRQYRRSHLYIYPEHRDHDPGRNGRGGYGDLFPANVPYLITSQGSSGSDRPFIEAVAFTLAAFRPDVKKRLVETGLLMPTVQMILRACGKNVAYPADYLTGKAHPTVFAGGNVDPLAMVKMAHAMTADAIPPMIQLALIEEDPAVVGGDTFDAGRPEKLFDTPSAIARIVRSAKYTRRMVVSAKGSHDANGRKLTYHWAVLRGDADRIRIRPLNKAGSEAELLVPFHGRRPIRPGAAMESSRVDIGAFVHNGKHYSAPAFVCFYSLADEARTYDAKGRIVEIGYGVGDSTIGWPIGDIRGDNYAITDWRGLLDLASGKGEGLPASLLRKAMTEPAVNVFRAAAREFEAAVAKEQAARKAYQQAEAARKQAGAAVAAARKKLSDAREAQEKDKAPAAETAVEGAVKTLADAQQAQRQADKQAGDAKGRLSDASKPATEVLTRKRPRLRRGDSIKTRLETMLNAVKDDVGLYVDNAAAIDALCEQCPDPARKKAFLAGRDDLVALGILAADGTGGWRLASIAPGAASAARRLTKYERNRLAWFHVVIARHLLYPGMLNVPFRRNFVQASLAAPKNWRDVYHHDENGQLIGWTRYEKGRKREFTAKKP